MKLQKLLIHLPRDFEIVLADVGSAGGLHPRWQAVRPIVTGLLFEPRDTSEVEAAGRDRIFPVGLGPAAGMETLNITALPNMSSTLRPNSSRLASYAKKFEHTRIIDREKIRVDALDSVAQTGNWRIDALKVDTQGSELGILQGARQTLTSSVVMAEVEVSFFQRYEEQALLWQLVPFMEECGFELIDLYRLKRYRRANSASVGNVSGGGGQRAGRLAYGDAIFFLREDILVDRIKASSAEEAEKTALRAVLTMLVYGKPDMAAHLLDLTSFAMSEELKERLGGWFGSAGKRAGVLHHVFDYLARHV